MTHLPWSKSLQQALDEVRRAEAASVPGRDSSAELELAKLALADAVLDALQAARLAQLPAKAVPASLPSTSSQRRSAS